MLHPMTLNKGEGHDSCLRESINPAVSNCDSGTRGGPEWAGEHKHVFIPRLFLLNVEGDAWGRKCGGEGEEISRSIVAGKN